MNLTRKFRTTAWLVILSVLTIDQWSKVWVKTNMRIGQEYEIVDWFLIHFVENNGMAFGFEFGGDIGKILLSVFRLVAIVFLVRWLGSLIKTGTSVIGIWAGALIVAGAIGNLIDSLIYGILFNESTYEPATFLSEDGGYAPFLFGKVVDMLYFPLWKGYLPEWLPVWGGEYFVFFQPVFNIADSAITCGAILFILFQKKILTTRRLY